MMCCDAGLLDPNMGDLAQLLRKGSCLTHPPRFVSFSLSVSTLAKARAQAQFNRLNRRTITYEH